MRYGLALALALSLVVAFVVALGILRPRRASIGRGTPGPEGPFRSGTSEYPLPEHETSAPRSPDASGLTVKIVGPDDEPVADALLCVLERKSRSEQTSVIERARTDVDGVARLSTSQVPFDLAVVAPRLQPVLRTVPQIPADGELLIRMQRGGTLAGRVVGIDDQPVADAKVYALGPGVPRSHEALAALPVPRYLDRSVATTADDGSFVLEGLCGDHRYAVTATKTGFAMPYRQVSRLRGVPVDDAPVQIVLLPAYRLRYKVVDATTGALPADPGLWPDPVSKGTSAPGASFAGGVMPIQLNSRRPWEEDEIWVAPVEAPDLGPFTVSLQLHGYEPLDAQVRAARWTESEPASPTLLRLERREGWRPPGRLRLLFRQPDGSPVAEQRFFGQPLVATLRAADGRREGLQFRFRPGPKGEMAFDRVPARRYFLVTRLGLVSRELQPQSFDVLSGQEAVVTIPFPAVGHATFELDTSAAVPAFVQVSLDRVPPLRRPLRLYDVHFRERKTTIPYLPAGRYRIRFMAFDFASDDVEFEIVPPLETKVVIEDGRTR